MRIFTRYIWHEVLSHAFLGGALFTFVLFMKNIGDLLEMAVRFRQPSPRGGADAATPRGDEVLGCGDRTARDQHRLVQHRPGAVLARACLSGTALPSPRAMAGENGTAGCGKKP